MDEYRFRAQQSPRSEAPMNSLVSPQRSGRPMPQPVPQDPRSTLPRRFTTDSGRVPTLSTISTQRLPEPQEYGTATQYKVQLLEKKKVEYERLREQKRRFEAEMYKLDQQQRQDEFEMAQIQEDIGRNGVVLPGRQSEPTTPPEYRETSSGFPTMFSRPNRYSTSSLTSAPGLITRTGRSGSQLASPQSVVPTSRFYDDQMPFRSVPGSRRNSDEDEKEEALRQDPTSHRSTNALNRYSMPVTRRPQHYENLDQTNSTAFLFKDEDTGAMESNNYVGADPIDDHFPQLYSHKGNPNKLSASTATADLASQHQSGETTPTNGWPHANNRHRQSLSTLSSIGTDIMGSAQSASPADSGTIVNRPYRHSMDFNQFREVSADSQTASAMSPPSNQILSTPPKLQTSFSTSSVPTTKDVVSAGSTPSSNANAHAQQHFHNHNASIGRIPPGAMKRHSRELSTDSHVSGSQAGAAFPSIQSTLQASAPSFGPIASSQSNAPSPASNGSNAGNSPGSSMESYAGYYSGYNQNSPSGNGYGPGMLALGMQNMNLNGYAPQNYTTGYSAVFQNAVQAQPRDSQQRVIQQRRAQDSEAMSKYTNLPLTQVRGNIYNLCKDQHGCRYLQKQLENRVPEEVHMIWEETHQYVVELMTDPFGNYLCQKLLEYCNDNERTRLIENASREMVRIALNQHGTRALQKMIEFVTLPIHVQIIMNALREEVVRLIQDLNGNHVIQKCLNKLSSDDAYFIFQAVGNNCVEVGTHRHGCCVLQRCIDHASGGQKVWLVGKITENALRLVHDPFGNYVVQYIIDINEPAFTEPLVKTFSGRVVELSRHKFSSNVIEKCLRCASDESKEAMASELLNPGDIDRLLRDSFGNYVVQTALEHSPYHLKVKLVETIRPILPNIKGTPYGRRLAAKIAQFESRSTNSSGPSTPADPSAGQIPMRHLPHRALAHQSIVSPDVYTNGMNGSRGHMTYHVNAGSTAQPMPNPPPQPPRMNAYSTYPGAGVDHANGEGSFF